MRTAGVAVRAFVAGAAGTAGGLALVGVLVAWAGRAMRRDLVAAFNAAKTATADQGDTTRGR